MSNTPNWSSAKHYDHVWVRCPDCNGQYMADSQYGHHCTPRDNGRAGLVGGGIGAGYEALSGHAGRAVVVGVLAASHRLRNAFGWLSLGSVVLGAGMFGLGITQLPPGATLNDAGQGAILGLIFLVLGVVGLFWWIVACCMAFLGRVVGEDAGLVQREPFDREADHDPIELLDAALAEGFDMHDRSAEDISRELAEAGVVISPTRVRLWQRSTAAA